MILRAFFVGPTLRGPWRFLVTVVGVAAGVAAVISTIAASRAAVASFAEGVDEVAGAARLEITRPGGLDGWSMNLTQYEAVRELILDTIDDESVDLVYLDPPFKSDQNYNVLFQEQDCTRSAAQMPQPRLSTMTASASGVAEVPNVQTTGTPASAAVAALATPGTACSCACHWGGSVSRASASRGSGATSSISARHQEAGFMAASLPG